MKFDNYDRTSRSLEILRDGLSQYIETQLKAYHKDEWWQKGIIKPLGEASKDKQLKNNVTPENCWNYLDLSQLFWIITYWETWNSIFSKNNDKYKKQTVFNLREIRNQHAHPNKKFDAFSNEMTTKNLDSMIEFLRGIGKDHEAEKIRVLKNKKFNNVPYSRNNAFVGREDQLLEIQNKFRQIISSKKNIILLTGLGGIGKTQLALEYAYRYQDLYTDGIFWVNSVSGFQEEFIKIAGNFISNYLFEKELREDEVAKLFFEYLDDNSKALIIIDNLEDFNILEKPIFGLIPTNLSGNVLITSRKGSMKSGDNSIEVKGIAPDEAIALLFSGTTRKKFFENQSSDSVDLEYAISVCSIFGYHPLAISRASAYLERFPQISLIDFLHRIKRKGSYRTLVEIGDDQKFQYGDYPIPIIRIFDLMWESLQDEESINILQIMALFDDMASIPLSLFMILANLSKDYKKTGEPNRIDLILENLLKLRFVEKQLIQKSYFSFDFFHQDPESDNSAGYYIKKEIEQRFYMHPLIQDYIKQTISNKENLIKSCYLLFSDSIRNPEKMQESIINKGVDKIIDEIQLIEILISKSSNPWMDVDSTLFCYKTILEKESHNIRDWNKVDLKINVSVVPKWFNPRDLPGFALQQIYNRLFLDKNIDSLQYFNYLKNKDLSALCEQTKVLFDSIFLEKTLLGHTSYIYDMVITNEDQNIISYSSDGTIKVWDINTGKVTYDTSSYENLPLFTAINFGNQRVITKYDEWKKWVDNEELWVSLFTYDLDSDESSRANYLSNCLGASINSDGTILIWDLENGKLINQLENEPDFYVNVTPYSLFFSIDYEKLIHFNFKGLIVWDLITWNKEIIIKAEDIFYQTNGIFDPEGRRLLSGDSEGNITIIDFYTGKISKIENVHAGWITKVFLHPFNGKLITASSDGLIKLWWWVEEELIEIKEFENLNTAIYDFAVSMVGDILISGHSDGTLGIWDLESGNLIKKFYGHGMPVNQILLSSDNNKVFSRSADNTIKIWNLKQIIEESDDELFAYDLSKIVISKNSKYTIGTSSKFALLFDLDKHCEISRIYLENEDIKGVAITEDGDQAIIFGKWVYLWNYMNDTNPQAIVINEDDLRAFIFVTANKNFALAKRTTCDEEEYQDEQLQDIVEVWSLDTNEIIFSIHVETDSLRSFIIDEGGKHVIAFYPHIFGHEELFEDLRGLEYWEIPKNEFNEDNHSPELPDGNSIISSDGRFLMVDKHPNLKEIRGLFNKEIISNLSYEYLSDVYVIHFDVTSDKHFAAIIVYDGTIHFWDLEKNYCMAIMPGSFTTCSVAPDGSKIIAIDNFGQVHFLKFLY